MEAPNVPDDQLRDGDITNQTIKALNLVKDKPFFLWWAPMMPHVPHDAPSRHQEVASPANLSAPDYIVPSFRKEWAEREALSLGMVRWLDDEVGRLVEKIRELGWAAEKNLDEMCADAWKWQSANPNGYE